MHEKVLRAVMAAADLGAGEEDSEDEALTQLTEEQVAAAALASGVAEEEVVEAVYEYYIFKR